VSYLARVYAKAAKKKEDPLTAFLRTAGALPLSNAERKALAIVIRDSSIHGDRTRMLAQAVVDRMKARIRNWEHFIKALEAKLEYMGELP
jgi:hypothetical protein